MAVSSIANAGNISNVTNISAGRATKSIGNKLSSNSLAAADTKIGNQSDTEKTAGQRGENLISSSADGDTLTAKKTNTYTEAGVSRIISESSDGTVSKMSAMPDDDELIGRMQLSDGNRKDDVREKMLEESKEKSDERAQKLAEDAKKQEQHEITADEDDDKKQIDSLIGYTKSQVEQFYREGRISRYDYEQNMSKREEESDERLDKQEKNMDEAIMGIADADEEKQDNNIKTEALENAIKFGRTDIVTDIFGNDN